MPFASTELLSACWGILSGSALDAVVPQTAQGFEPFHAVYRRKTCLPLIEAALEADRWRVDSWFPQADIRPLTVEEIHKYDPHGLAFLNVNTAGEFQEAETLARQLDAPRRPSHIKRSANEG
jgi:molybdopterin-guanine dinucleotide biosynthesis protein A